MDSKNLKDGLLADAFLASGFMVRKVKDIRGASIDSDNVVLDLSKFGPGAEVVFARIGTEIASLSQVDQDATLDFVSAATVESVLELSFKIKLGE